MVIDLAAYRRTKVRAHWTAADAEQELVCVNWKPARILSVAAVAPVKPLPSPALPPECASAADLAAFQALARALATQI